MHHVYFYYYVRYGLLVGLTAVNIIAFPLLFLVFFGSKTSRQALFTFAPLLLYVFLYDSNRALRKLDVFEVHTEDIYRVEVKIQLCREHFLTFCICVQYYYSGKQQR